METQKSLVRVEDLKVMYSKHRFGGEVLLWLEGWYNYQKHDAASGGFLKRQKNNWRRLQRFERQTCRQILTTTRILVSAGLRNNMESPPDVPAFCSNTKRPSKESLGDSTAVTFVKAL